MSNMGPATQICILLAILFMYCPPWFTAGLIMTGLFIDSFILV